MIWFYKRAVVFLLARSRRLAGMRLFGLLPPIRREQPGPGAVEATR
jgi:hypothetical protein